MKKLNTWSDEKFQRLLGQCAGIVSCSFGVCTIRSKKTGRWSTVIIFNDDDDEARKFTFAFELGADHEAFHLAKMLVESREVVKRLAAGGTA